MVLTEVMLHTPITVSSLSNNTLSSHVSVRPGRFSHEPLSVNYRVVDRAIEEDARSSIVVRHLDEQVWKEVWNMLGMTREVRGADYIIPIDMMYLDENLRQDDVAHEFFYLDCLICPFTRRVERH